MTKIVKVAAAQLSSVFLNKEKTIEKACKAILEAGENGADLIVFPEAFISGYPDWVWLIPNSKGADLNELYVKLVHNAVSVPDDSTRQLGKAAKTAGINVVIGMHERNSETSSGSLFNSLLFIDDQGLIMGKHRKLIPTGGERLIWSQGDGSTLRSYDTSAGKVAGLICWENFMPLARTALYAQNVEIYCAPTADTGDNWLATMKHIGREGSCFVVGVASTLTGEDIPIDLPPHKPDNPVDGWIVPGDGIICGPLGDTLAGPMREEKGFLILRGHIHIKHRPCLVTQGIIII